MEDEVTSCCLLRNQRGGADLASPLSTGGRQLIVAEDEWVGWRHADQRRYHKALQRYRHAQALGSLSMRAKRPLATVHSWCLAIQSTAPRHSHCPALTQLTSVNDPRTGYTAAECAGAATFGALRQAVSIMALPRVSAGSSSQYSLRSSSNMPASCLQPYTATRILCCPLL